MTKIRDIIQEFIPCEVCGNNDIKNFYFYVLVHQGSQPYVRCCECEEEYYSTKARKIITEIEDRRRLSGGNYVPKTSGHFPSNDEILRGI